MQSLIIQTRFAALNIPKGLENYVSRVHGLSDTKSQSIDDEKKRLIDFINYFRGEVVFFLLFKPPVTDNFFFLFINEFNEWALKYIESNLKYKCIIFKIPMVIGYLGIENTEPSESLSASSASTYIFKNTYFEIIEINDLYDAINSRLSLDKKFSTININSQNILTAEQVVSACFAKSQSEQPECLILNNNLDLDSEININCTKSNQNYLKEKYKGSEDGLGAKKLLSIVVPTYNEENGIAQFYCRLKSVLNKLSSRFEYEIIFINDCSKDSTLEKLLLLQFGLSLEIPFVVL